MTPCSSFSNKSFKFELFRIAYIYCRACLGAAHRKAFIVPGEGFSSFQKTAGGRAICVSRCRVWSKIQPYLSARVATGRPPADDKQTLEAILFVLTRQGVDGAIFPLNTAVMSRHGEDTGDGPRMELLSVYGTCSFLNLTSKEGLISKSVHGMARLCGQKGRPTGRQNLW